MREFGGAIGADGYDLEAEGREPALDFAQLAELRVAVGSPASAIKDEQRPTFAHRPSEIDRLAVNGRQTRHWNPSAGRQRLHLFGCRVDALSGSGSSRRNRYENGND